MDYKKYSLENLENWMHDTISSGDATPQEIYDVIVGVVKETSSYHKECASQADELLALLNGGTDNNKYQDYLDEILSCDKDDPSPECRSAWNDFWEDVDEKHSREYNLREAEYYNKRAQLDADYEAIKAAGGYDYTPLTTKDKVVKWQLPVEVDGLTGDCYVKFPDDLLEAANLKEGDVVNWIDRGDGSFELRKVTKPLGMDEC